MEVKLFAPCSEGEILVQDLCVEKKAGVDKLSKTMNSASVELADVDGLKLAKLPKLTKDTLAI